MAREILSPESVPGVNRRSVVTGLAAGILGFASKGAFAEELTRTPRQTEGPFYPDHLPLDTDNDLLIVNDSITQAVGEITHLSGRILDMHGEPIRNAVVEIWQVDHNGSYFHSKGANPQHNNERDTNFQGFGRFLTSAKGEYYFRTIKPVPYPGRTPHIHFAVKMKGQEKYTTQCYVAGETRNSTDGVLNAIKDPKGKASVIVPFSSVKGSRIGELAAKFDIIMDLTPATA